jgi:hypothetical protein
LNLIWELLPLIVIACLPLFEQLIERGANRFQKTILERLHDHSFSSIISNMFSNSHWACLRSYARPSMGAWLFTCPIIPCFHFPSNVFSYMLQTKLSLPHPLDLGMTHYIYGQPLDPWGSTSSVAPMVGRGLHPMMLFRMHLHPLW